MKILKIVGAVFCALMALGSFINSVSPAVGSSRLTNVVFAFAFLVLLILLIRSIVHQKMKDDAGPKGTSEQRPEGKRKENQGEALEMENQGQRLSKKEATTVTLSSTPHETSSSNTAMTRDNCLDVTDVTLESYIQPISSRVKNLLWFLNGPLQNYCPAKTEWEINTDGYKVQICCCGQAEPSAIDICLPLSLPTLTDNPPSPGYYPNYQDLLPAQRMTYLRWLTDITVPADIGYVFIFYYGLERHLIFGDADEAFSMILLLRKYHHNKSFLSYSSDAIFLYSIIRQKPEALDYLNLSEIDPSLRLFISGIRFHGLSVEDIISAHRKFSFDNTRYIKNNPDLFLTVMNNRLYRRFGQSMFPISVDDFYSAVRPFTISLANYSLLPMQRTINLPDIATAPRLHGEIYTLLVATHEEVKSKLREKRKEEKAANNK